MKTTKKFFALLLVVSLMASMLAMGVSAAGGAQIVSQQLSLGDDLTMRFGVEVDSQYQNDAVISVTVAGKTASYNVAEMTAENGKYTVSVDLAAAQMTDAIAVKVISGETELDADEYSVRAYCQYLLEGDYTDATKQMVKEVLNYGAKAQIYFDYNTENLANAGYELESAAVPTEGYDMTIDGSVAGINLYGTSLVFSGKIAVRYYFSASDVSGYTFTANGVSYEAVAKQEGLYYVEIGDINPQEYADMINLTVSDGTDSLVVGYCPLSYIVRMSGKTDSTAMKDLLAAMYSYYLAACEFTGIEEDDGREVLPVTIIDHMVTGEWEDPVESSASLGPHNSYDGNTGNTDADGKNDYWNPKVTDFMSGEGIIYVLENASDLTNFVMYCHRMYYFTLYGSPDGVTYDQIIRVGSGNTADYYTGEVGNYVCDMSDLEGTCVKYLKLEFTGCANGDTTHVGLFEVELSGKEPILDSEGAEAQQIIAHQLVGPWLQDREGNSTIGPQKSYDGNVESYWNPQATNYKSDEGIVFTLNEACDITNLQITFAKREYYFKVYFSTDGVDYLPVAIVTAENSANYYDGFVANLSDLTNTNVKYIKVMFTGNAGSLNTFISLCEVVVSGKAATPAVDNRPVKAAPIVGHTIIGTWTNSYDGSTSLGPQKSYDGDAESSYWQGQVNNFTSGAGIVYTLDEAYDLKTITLTQKQRPYYFNISVSADGENYLPLVNVTAANYTQYYNGNVCTIDGITNTNISYIKLIFTGNTQNSLWTSLSEVAVTGVASDYVEEESFKISGAFSSEMVLQRNAQIPVWGWAEAGATVTGEFAGEKVTAVADSTGYWKLVFSAQQANAQGQTMKIYDSLGNGEVFSDVLIGDVYIINGQSNAELAVNRTAAHLDNTGKEAVKELFRHDSGIRLFHQQKKYVIERTDLWSEPQADVINEDWTWTVATDNDAFWTFSAMGMYFAKYIRESVSEDIPIGLVNVSCGGAYLHELMPEELNAKYGYTGANAVTVGGYYNTLIHPFVGYPIAGMLFFQGESNNYILVEDYASALTDYVTELRTRWGQDFNFYNVQLSSYGLEQVENHVWPCLPQVRDAQYQVLNSLDKYYLTVSMDVGYNGEIDMGTNVQDFAHPKDKKTVGERVAKQALAVYYNVMEVGEKSFSPVPSEIQWNTDGILISFRNADTLALATGDALVGFQCVINEEVVDVAAQIVNGNQVLLPVDATTVSEIRYAIFSLCYPEDANLVNGGGLPAPAFAIANPNEFTTNKIVVKNGKASASGWYSLGVSAASPYHSYDGNMESYWNPQVSNFSDAPSITYTLNVSADISGLTFAFMNRREYFTVYASTDGSTFTEVATATDANYTDYVCTISNLDLKNVKAIKLVFTGSSDGSKWIGFYEVIVDAVPAGKE